MNPIQADARFKDAILAALRKRLGAFSQEEERYCEEFASMRIACFDTVSSTMDLARELFPRSNSSDFISVSGQSDPRSFLAVLAREQNAGRGRAGRTWTSAKDTGIYVTFAFPTSLPAIQVAALPLAVGVATLNTVEHFGAAVRLKWPNDLIGLRNGEPVGKLCGILVERGSEQDIVTVGIGINLLPVDGATSLMELCSTPPNLADVFAELSLQILAAKAAFSAQGFKPFLPTWNSRSLLLGREVSFSRNFKRHTGKALRVEIDGALVVETPLGEERIYAGDVDLVRSST